MFAINKDPAALAISMIGGIRPGESRGVPAE